MVDSVKTLWAAQLVLALVLAVAPISRATAELPQVQGNECLGNSLPPNSVARSIWQTQIGEGFRRGTQMMGISTGVTWGVLMLGGEQRHHLALSNISYGYMLGDIQAAGHWYRGNWEVRAELIGGGQFAAETCWVMGFAPHLRYHFATGTRWIPFVDAGGGVALTNIGDPDLRGTFQFNLQAGAGVNWFIKDNLAINVEGRYLHISCAGLHNPNYGVNTLGILVGVGWFF